MDKSPVTGSTLKEKKAASASTAARSKNSAKSAKSATGKKQLSESDLLAVFQATLNRMQERFGEIYFLREDGDEPAILVLPKSLDLDKATGIVTIRQPS